MSGKARGGLGRGLGALIPQGTPMAVPAPSAPENAAPEASGYSAVGTATLEPVAEQLSPVPGARFAELQVDSIAPNSRQPRQIFDEEALEELKVSIREVGFLQPIV